MNPVLTVKRSFTAKNTGELPIEVYGFYINGLRCEGYGFKVLNCIPFMLSPNATKKIEIAFTPEFTLSRVERKLLILTSVGPDSNDVERGIVTLNLLATLPVHSLNLCGAVLARPFWERPVQWIAIILSTLLLICVLATSFFEADRVLRGALVNYSKEGTVQPPLDLRFLSDVSTHTMQVRNATKEKVTNDEKSKTKKEDTCPDWSLMNVKKCKDKDVQKGLKIPDWSAEEERKFRLDTESKNLLSFKRFEEISVDNTIASTISTVSTVSSTSSVNTVSTVSNINTVSSVSTVNTSTYGSKKKNKKQSNIQETQVNNYVMDNTLADTQLVQEKKFTVNASTKSSPISNRKGKTMIQSNVKEEPKLINHEVQVDVGIVNNNRNNKPNNKRKQTGNNSNNNNNHNNHVSSKKTESTGTQKSVHLSEEETSSTTTESSTHDETTSWKVNVMLLMLD